MTIKELPQHNPVNELEAIAEAQEIEAKLMSMLENENGSIILQEYNERRHNIINLLIHVMKFEMQPAQFLPRYRNKIKEQLIILQNNN